MNDHSKQMIELVRRLSYINVHPYYVYVHDLVQGTEDLRTMVATAIRVEKRLRGASAGFNTPLFVVDAPGGGGKRGRQAGALAAVADTASSPARAAHTRAHGRPRACWGPQQPRSRRAQSNLAPRSAWPSALW